MRTSHIQQKLEAKSSKPVFVEISIRDLRQLLFWAGVGVAKSNTGQYSETIEEVIYNNRRIIKMKPSEFSGEPVFGFFKRS